MFEIWSVSVCVKESIMNITEDWEFIKYSTKYHEKQEYLSLASPSYYNLFPSNSDFSVSLMIALPIWIPPNATRLITDWVFKWKPPLPDATRLITESTRSENFHYLMSLTVSMTLISHSNRLVSQSSAATWPRLPATSRCLPFLVYWHLYGPKWGRSRLKCCGEIKCHIQHLTKIDIQWNIPDLHSKLERTDWHVWASMTSKDQE